MKPRLFPFLAILIVVASFAQAADADAEKYTLRYKFKPGETLRWDVVRRLHMRATVSGNTKTTETVDKSVNAWRVKEVKTDSSAVFEHLVETIDMWQKLSGRNEMRYSSKTDKKPPLGFEDAAKRVGVPLSRISLDSRGKTLLRENLVPNPGGDPQGQITVPLPEEPIAVGHTWSEKHEAAIPLETGGSTKILIQQSYTLESVKNGVATIRMATSVLTPVNNPALEAKLIERESKGLIRFDIDAGRVLGEELEVDKRVVGFRGPDSCLNYVTRFTQALLPEPAK
jgi:hypothetical protein